MTDNHGRLRDLDNSDFFAHDSSLGLTRRVVYSSDDFTAAEQRRLNLVDRGIPTERIRVTSDDLTQVRRATGKPSGAYAAARGALSGLLVGLLVGRLLTMFDVVSPAVGPIWVAANSALLGAVCGAAAALIGYGFSRKRRSGAPPVSVSAGSYDVQVDAALADRAALLLRNPALVAVGEGSQAQSGTARQGGGR